LVGEGEPGSDRNPPQIGEMVGEMPHGEAAPQIVDAAE
jgi:hypothetical protein